MIGEEGLRVGEHAGDASAGEGNGPRHAEHGSAKEDGDAHDGLRSWSTAAMVERDCGKLPAATAERYRANCNCNPVAVPYIRVVPDFALSCLLPGSPGLLGSQRESRKG